MNPDDIYEIVKQRFDCWLFRIREDYIINLVGTVGLDILLANKLIEPWGYDRGTKTYALCENANRKGENK